MFFLFTYSILQVHDITGLHLTHTLQTLLFALPRLLSAFAAPTVHYKAISELKNKCASHECLIITIYDGPKANSTQHPHYLSVRTFNNSCFPQSHLEKLLQPLCTWRAPACHVTLTWLSLVFSHNVSLSVTEVIFATHDWPGYLHSGAYEVDRVIELLHYKSN